jgi:hypothetical protein
MKKATIANSPMILMVFFSIIKSDFGLAWGYLVSLLRTSFNSFKGREVYLI